jgi:hypothetical protein
LLSPTGDALTPATSRPLQSYDALEKILTKSDLTCKYCFFIDGLDEYQETDDTLKGELAKGVLELAQLPSVKLVVSSRPENIFRLKFATCPTMKLHDLTRRDIAAYVDTEIRRIAIPQVPTSIETQGLRLLCDEVIEKAEGVFLWVTIAVASILNDIADREIPTLRSRLWRLDPRLKVLFKQVLTERVQASHRKQVARSLLTEGHFKKLYFHSWVTMFAAIQALSPHVDESQDYRLLLDGRCGIDAHVSDTKGSLPGRSCGLFSASEDKTMSNPSQKFSEESLPRTPLYLSHSSLYEFLDEQEIWTLLLEQAGNDFKVDEAVAVGQIADLVWMLERFSDLDPRYVRGKLAEILHRIEMTTGLTQTKLVSLVEELLGRETRHPEPGTLALAELLWTDWDPLYEDGREENSDIHVERSRSVDPRDGFEFPLMRRGVARYGSDLLSLTLSFGSSCYLKHKINTCRGLPLKIGTSLLFYPLWTMVKYLKWVERYFPGEDVYAEVYHPAPVRLLLGAGADPNECRLGLTPWSVVLRKICCPGPDDNFPLRRVDPPDGVASPKESFLDKLEIARLMLEHGADPFFCMETQGGTISPQIFAELLGRECCSGSAFSDCTCAYARQIQPRLAGLVELVEVRRYIKGQMRTPGELILIEAWLVVVLAYVVHSLLEWVS